MAPKKGRILRLGAAACRRRLTAEPTEGFDFALTVREQTFWPAADPEFSYEEQTLRIYQHYMGADKSLARPGRKQARATEDFDVHIPYLLSSLEEY